MSIEKNHFIKFRQTLHQHPEVSGNEKETAARVVEFVSKFNPTNIITSLGGHGIAATWDSGIPGPEIMFRSELDALPIQEINEFNYKSNYNGVSHKCGHDGHTTILCSLAEYLHTNKPAKGKVHLLFQPAEENGEGAAAVLADKKFNDINPDFVFALHNLPGFPLNQVVIKENTFTAAVTSIIIKLKGKTSHAAEPENGANPALAISSILSESLALENNNANSNDMNVITPVYIEMGEKAYGISAGEGSIHFTVRCWNDSKLESLTRQIESIAYKIAKEEKLKAEIEYTQTFHANMNDQRATQLVRNAAKQANLDVNEKEFPFKWGEDFGLFTAKFKGCMFGLGAGTEMPALHNPDYDFPDELIVSGSKIFTSILNETMR